MSSSKEWPSPCVGVCTLIKGWLCSGCYRNIAEIKSWSVMENDEKRACLAQLDERRRK
ncbi:MAG: DUF1289 domain-containing protein, partial [Chitinophagaceae bacterium]|nr:DUF1289 domain-containing protein [Chitinophagaceae bacterium]